MAFRTDCATLETSSDLTRIGDETMLTLRNSPWSWVDYDPKF